MHEISNQSELFASKGFPYESPVHAPSKPRASRPRRAPPVYITSSPTPFIGDEYASEQGILSVSQQSARDLLDPMSIEELNRRFPDSIPKNDELVPDDDELKYDDAVE